MKIAHELSFTKPDAHIKFQKIGFFDNHTGNSKIAREIMIWADFRAPWAGIQCSPTLMYMFRATDVTRTRRFCPGR